LSTVYLLQFIHPGPPLSRTGSVLSPSLKKAAQITEHAGER